MAGHNKWSKVKHKKAVADERRSREFGKLARLIAAESKKAGGDESAPSLRAVIEKARSANMPKENIERAVAKGKNDTGADLEMLTYEMYGPGGVAILIDTLTDNRNRTNQELRHLVGVLGYSLAEPGAASWAFAKQGSEWQPTTLVEITSDADTEALGALIESIENHDDVTNIATNAQ